MAVLGGEGKVRPLAAEHGPRQVEARLVAARRLGLHHGAARIGQAEQLGRLVEGFADRVVDGGAEPAIFADAVDGNELGMPARDQQQQIGKGQLLGQAGCQRMCLQVVDGDERRRRRAPGLAVVKPTMTPPIRPGAGSGHPSKSAIDAGRRAPLSPAGR
jgi:hypothetical protein